MRIANGFTLAMVGVLISSFLGCGQAGQKKGVKERHESAQLGDAIVRIAKVDFQEWDPDAPTRLSKRRRTPRHLLRIDLVIVRSFEARRNGPIKYYGWIDRKSKADSKNYATLTDENGVMYSLVKGSGPGGLQGLEYDGIVDKITDSRTDHLIFRLPVEAEGMFELELSGWAFKLPGTMRFQVPLEDWSLTDSK